MTDLLFELLCYLILKEPQEFLKNLKKCKINTIISSLHMQQSKLLSSAVSHKNSVKQLVILEELNVPDPWWAFI